MGWGSFLDPGNPFVNSFVAICRKFSLACRLDFSLLPLPVEYPCGTEGTFLDREISFAGTLELQWSAKRDGSVPKWDLVRTPSPERPYVALIPDSLPDGRPDLFPEWGNLSGVLRDWTRMGVAFFRQIGKQSKRCSRSCFFLKI